MFFLYFLYSPKSDKYYIGHTENVAGRLFQHNNDEKDSYTSKHRPWILKAAFEAGTSRAEALKVERWIKKQKSLKLIELVCDPEYVPKGSLAQLVRVPDIRD